MSLKTTPDKDASAKRNWADPERERTVRGLVRNISYGVGTYGTQLYVPIYVYGTLELYYMYVYTYTHVTRTETRRRRTGSTGLAPPSEG